MPGTVGLAQQPRCSGIRMPSGHAHASAVQDIRGFTRTEWCATLAAVSQEPVLFPASIAYNIGEWQLCWGCYGG